MRPDQLNVEMDELNKDTDFQKERERDNRKVFREDRLHGWKRWLSYQYIAVCVFDFMIAPAYRGASRETLEEIIPLVSKLSPEVQMRVLTEVPWEPLTLQGGAFYHIAMGAILTGAALMGKGKNA